MAREPLDTLLRLRRLGVQDRIHALAAAIRAEESAHLARAACADWVARETSAARPLAERDATLANFAAWRVRAVQALRAAEAEAHQAANDTQAARAALGDARRLRAVEPALERRKLATNRRRSDRRSTR